MAGWYPDPDGAATQRYWDGGSWTDQLAPNGPAPTSSTSKQSDAMVLLRIVAGIVAIVLALDLFGVIHFY